MKLTAMLRCWWRAIAHGGRTRSEVTEEMEFHLDARAADLERSGLDAQEARRRARLEMGRPEVQGEKYREAIGLRWLDELGDDLRYAWRMLWRSKGFTAVAVGSLALGIGANTIIFSLAKGVLLDRLAVPHPEQLRQINMVNGGMKARARAFWGSDYDDADNNTVGVLMTYPIYKLMTQQNQEHPVMQPLFAFKDMEQFIRLTASVDGHAYVVSGQMVSGNYYEQLGVRPQLGRGVEPTEDTTPGDGRVVVISDAMWTRVFARSPDVIGKTMLLNLVPMTIVGVNPSGFTGASTVQIAPDVFFPLSMQPVLSPLEMKKGHPSVLDDTELWWVQVMARAKPGISDATAQAALSTWMQQDAQATMVAVKGLVWPTVRVMDGSQGIQQANRAFSTQIYVLLGMVGLVLLLACANLANLLLARSSARQREMAVRLALGASRGRVLRQVMTESLLLSSLGGVAGVVLGYAGRNVIPHMYNTPWHEGMLRADFDWMIFAFTVGVSMLTGLLFGVAPAWQAMRAQVNSGLKDGAATATRRRKGWMGRGLVVVQVALSMLLVIAAGLFAATLRNIYKQAPGFDTKNILMFTVQAPEARYPGVKAVQLHERIEERLSRVPGVEAMTLSRNALLSGGGSQWGLIPTGHQERARGDDIVWIQEIGRSFFDVYRIPMLFGRSFNSSDTETSPTVAIINQKLAKRDWPNEDPLGKTFITTDEDNRIYTVVGVVADTKQGRLTQAAPPTVYFPYVQRDGARVKEMTYELKTPLPVAEVLPQIRAAVAEVDKDVPLRDVRTQQEQINATNSQQRTFAVLTGAFGVLALVLACIGIYGLMAYDVARRTSEIGIRMALGAKASQMLGMVLREASWMAIAGIGVGLGAALMLTKYVKSMLYGLTPNDPWILGGAAALLFVFALLAGWGPARRASRVEPMEALRHE